jgi:sugar phosphate isomerase/epimerase
MSAFDVDADGQVDLLAYNTWFKHTGGRNFKPVKLADEGGLIFAGYFKDSRYPQIVISPGDGKGHFRQTEVVIGHGWHEARLADLDGDGDLDLLNKPYNWDTPRVDVWLNNGTRASTHGAGTSRSFRGPVGLQLYSLRDLLGRNLPLGLQTARGLGFREVELAGTYARKPEAFRAALLRAGLQPVSSIVEYQVLETSLDQAIADARALGVRYLGTAGIPHTGPFTEAEARKAAADFNRFGEALARQGLRFFYRHHGFEFVPRGQGTWFDLLVQEARPEWVTFEMDLFWTVHAGQDPVKLLERYPHRWSLLQVKDMRPGTPTGQLTGSEDVRNDVAGQRAGRRGRRAARSARGRRRAFLHRRRVARGAGPGAAERALPRVAGVVSVAASSQC